MSKIFRLHTNGSSTYQDWNSSPAFPYNQASRDTIDDPDGATASHEITSIPSPFARIDLVKTAFKEVCKPVGSSRIPNLDGKTIFHKMVSDSLDVAEIFFNLDKYKSDVEVIKWDPNLMIGELLSSPIVGHQYLGDSLMKYLRSDADTYNFGALQNIYLLNYIHGPAEINIIGATSPATLFFSNANDLSYVDNIYFGTDRPFDGDFQPLYKRDHEFIKYLFALRKSISNFAGIFPEVDAYLSATFNALTDQVFKNELRQLKETDIDGFGTISVQYQQQNDYVEVLGYQLRKKSTQQASGTSDFTIRTTLSTPLSPMVLPVETGNRYSLLRYTTAQWGKDNAAPYYDPQPDLTQRTLPNDGSLAPYLTISDLLEDAIVRVPHKFNSENYFDGHIKDTSGEYSYLLPVKPLLFEYFTADELRGAMPDGRPMIEMEVLAGNLGVKATLRIPIKGNSSITYVEYTRKYYSERSADISQNQGTIKGFEFTGFVMPCIKFNDVSQAIYNISCVQPDTANYELIFFNGGQKVIPKSVTCRDNSHQFIVKADNYLLENTLFDFIQVRNNFGHCGIILPLFTPQQSIETFEFAIDLGTSNTHIEFRKGKEQPKAFCFTANERPLCEFFIPTRNEAGNLEDLIAQTEFIEKDFIPEEVGQRDFRFPTRTVLSAAKIVNWNDVVDPFTMANLPFTYDKRLSLPFNNYKSNIKWGNGDDLSVMETYVKCLLLIIRNKVLINKGDLQHTSITWFYPISMAPKRLQHLRRTWQEAFAKYFGQGAIHNMTESSAPIQYFFQRYATATNLVNVDIGGGTSDIAFASDKRITHVTSFRFASNSLFQNSFTDLDNTNGIVDWHKSSVRQILIDKDFSELIKIFDSESNTHPANMASFLFSLKDNSIPKAAGVNSKAIDFNYILQQDEKFKIVFIIFYTSIIYHIAQIIKQFGLEVPRHLSFSGNGSKVIKIITDDPRLLAKYTKKVFEEILGRPYGKELEILGLEKESNPKESTCKGGIIGYEEDDLRDKIIVLKSDGSGIVAPADTYDVITDTYKQRVIDSVEKFFDFTLNTMNAVFNFDDNFGVERASIDIAREVAHRDLPIYLEKGIQQRVSESEPNATIEETFFFYPIKGVIQAISAEIYDKLNS